MTSLPIYGCSQANAALLQLPCFNTACLYKLISGSFDVFFLWMLRKPILESVIVDDLLSGKTIDSLLHSFHMVARLKG